MSDRKADNFAISRSATDVRNPGFRLFRKHWRRALGGEVRQLAVVDYCFNNGEVGVLDTCHLAFVQTDTWSAASKPFLKHWISAPRSIPLRSIRHTSFLFTPPSFSVFSYQHSPFGLLVDSNPNPSPHQWILFLVQHRVRQRMERFINFGLFRKRKKSKPDPRWSIDSEGARE